MSHDITTAKHAHCIQVTNVLLDSVVFAC